MIKKKSGRILTHYFKFPLWGKLFVFYALFIMIPVLSIGSFSFITSREALLNKTKAYMQKQVQIISNNINSELNAMIQKSNILLLNSDNIGAILAKNYDDSGTEKFDAFLYLEKMITSALNTDIANGYRFKIYTDNKSLVENHYLIDYKEIERRLTDEKLGKLAALDTVWLFPDPKGSGETNGRYISALRKIGDKRSGKMLILSIDIPVNTIENQLDIKNIKDISQTGYTNYINSQGEELIISRNNTESYLKIGDLIDEKKDEGYVSTEDSLVVYCQTQINKFYVVISVPYREIFRETNSILFTTIGIMILAAVVLIPISLMVSRMLTGRIYRFLKELEFLDINSSNNIVLEDKEDEISRIIFKFNEILLKNRILLTKEYDTKLQLIETENKLIQISAERNAMELKLLQAQVDPHFIYNTFSSIKIALKSNKCFDDIEVILDSLVKFYRLSLNNGRPILKVKQEIELTKEYLEIQNFINKNRFNFILEVDEKVNDVWCPKFLLQPIVENAIFHGFKEKEEDCILILIAEKDESNLIFRVSDNGIGFDKERINEIMNYNVINSYGLKNVRDRIKLFFGDQAEIKIKSDIDEGTEVKIIFPIRTYEELAEI